MRIDLTAVVWWLLMVLLVSIMVFFKMTNAFNIESNVLKLLPKTEVDTAIERAFENFSEINMQQLVFLIENVDKAEAIKSADELAASLIASPWIDEVVTAVPASEQMAIGQFNYAFRYHLLTDGDATLLKAKSFDNFSDDVIQQAYSAFSGGVIGLIEKDPFLLSYRFGLANSDSELSSFNIEENHLIRSSTEGYSVLLRATLSQSPSSIRS